MFIYNLFIHNVYIMNSLYNTLKVNGSLIAPVSIAERNISLETNKSLFAKHFQAVRVSTHIAGDKPNVFFNIKFRIYAYLDNISTPFFTVFK